ncbi:hypothetical protein [Effusibacillus dendaii]|uniref:Uncharacterized protein n=1 Tax=Effusibacillus dendaii TaxID=2743772 RepID=A0A7I8DKD9_9BACL|nr:hypothetical protein [Effusibacillus dendaii]BCJ88371.1 hypothetical protein skT53_33560 [Effusibacillus dendaii]
MEKGGDMYMIVHILLGLLLAFVLWKLLKISFKTIVWLVLIGLIVALIAPGMLFVVGGIGFVILSVLGGLVLLTLFGFFFLDGD